MCVQKDVIRYLVENGKSVEEIMADRQLNRSDGSAILKTTVTKWKKRFENEGHMNTKKRSGRPRILDSTEEQHLISYVKKNNKMVYSDVKLKTKFKGHRRSVNRYALRNNISKTFNSIQCFQCD